MAAGEMPLALVQSDGRPEVIHHESLLMAAISVLPDAADCRSDLERFGAEVLVDTLRTHPRLITGVLCRHPALHRAGQASHHEGMTR
jgi:hypothetical protein